MSEERKSWLTEHLATVIVALFTTIASIVGGWFMYNQSTKDKETIYRIEELKRAQEEKITINNRQIAIIYSEMYDLMHKLDVDRVFIIQPHPEFRHQYLSVYLEVDKNGISQVRDLFQNIPISDIPKLTKLLATNNWLFFTDIDTQVDSERALALMRSLGSTNICIRQLVNTQGEWIGNLVAENTKGKKIYETEALIKLKATANTIQFILPAIN